MILAAADGKTNSQIARDLNVCVDTVRAWRGRWLEWQAISLSDLDAGSRLVDLPRPGAPVRITAEQTCQLIAMACEAPAERPISHWTGREIADEARRRGIIEQISPRHAARLLKKGT
jgi:transposase